MMSLVRRAVRYELGMWRSLYRWIVRRRPAGGAAFGYAAGVTPVFGVFVGLSAIEIPILHLLLPWPTARQISLVLGCYGLFWMLGLLASFRVHPHVVDDTGLRVRHSFSVDFTIPWENVDTVGKKYRPLPGARTVRFEQTDAGLILYVAVSGQTSVDIVLREPVTIPLPRGASEPVSEIRINVDDPDAFVARARIRQTDPR